MIKFMIWITIIYNYFWTDDRKEFLEKLRNGEYILPDESIQFGDRGIRLVTENEKTVLRDWIRSYVTNEGNKNYIFNSK